MQRLAAFIFYCLVIAPLHAVSPLLTLENKQLPSPAGVGAHSAQFIAASPAILLSWTESGSNHTPIQHYASFDPQTRSWKQLSNSTDATPLHQQTVAGEVIVSHAGRTAKAWFDPNPKDPSVLLSLRPDSREPFLMPARIEDTRPTGKPDLVLLADGTVFVSWPEHYNQDETALWLRRISPGGSLSVPVLLAVLPAGEPSIQLALVKDFDDKPAQLLIAYTIGKDNTSQVVTRLLTVDPANNNKRANPCLQCPDPDDAARGYALRGRVVALSLEHHTVTVQHDELPGILSTTITEFKVDPTVLKTAAVGNDLFARIEKRDNNWWLFSARLLVRP